MKVYIGILVVIFIIVLAVLFLIYHSPPVTSTPSYMVGKWEGRCGVLNNWWDHGRLEVRIEIGREGEVYGTIGDATLREGQLIRNSRLQAWLWDRDYIIEAGLAGFILKGEGIGRKAVAVYVPDLNRGGEDWHFETRSPGIADSESIRIYSERFIMTRVAEERPVTALSEFLAVR